MPATPFTDQQLLTKSLYNVAERLTQRTCNLHAAKTRGEDAAETIAALAERHAHPREIVCDIGCGRGTSTLRLAARLRPHTLIALDQSQALLNVTAERAREAGYPLRTMCADFHRLPLTSGQLTLAVAAFCLYHSARPESVVAEIARCVEPKGRVVLATKSADSYSELDEVLATAELDVAATTRPSLYQTFHSGNAAALAASALDVVDVVEQHHEFRFPDLQSLAAYLATSPKSPMPAALRDAAELCAELRRRLPDRPVVTTSTLTYVVGVAR